MNNRKRNRAAVRRKAEYRRRRELHKVLDLILDINGVGARSQSETGDMPTAFMRFSGHVGCVDIDIHNKGWDHDLRSDNFYFRTYEPMKKHIMELESIKEDLLGTGHEPT
ncbi:hypothetical protein [Lacrimispora sp.]|uniref:hypothetical protein n=1 Tax=Lacrimispora sp. TaxID=2719234 RepID=UPI00346121D0